MDILPQTTIAINTSVSGSLKYSPFYLMFGRWYEPSLLQKLRITSVLSQLEPLESPEEKEKRMISIRLKAMQNLLTFSEDLWRKRNQGIRQTEYADGAKVLLKIKVPMGTKASRFPWDDDLHLVMRRVGEMNYEVMNNDS